MGGILPVHHQQGDSQALGVRLLKKGQALQQANQLKESVWYFEAAQEVFRLVGDRYNERVTLSHIEEVCWAMKQYEQAQNYRQQSQVITQDIDSRLWEAFGDRLFGFRGLGRLINRLTSSLCRSLATLFSQIFETFIFILSGFLYFFLKQLTPEIKQVGTRLHAIGLVYHHQGEYDQALDSLQQALAINQKIGDREGEGTTLNNIGGVYCSLGQYQQALDYYQQALVINRGINHQANEGVSLNGIGRISENLGQYQQALDYYQQALAIRRDIDDREGEGASLNSIGGGYSSLGQYQQALNYYQQALVIFQNLGHRAGEGTTLNNIGIVYQYLGQYKQALGYHQQSLAIKQEIGNREGEGASLDSIGRSYHNLGQGRQALEFYQQALAIAQKIGNRAGQAATLNNIGAILNDIGVNWQRQQEQQEHQRRQWHLNPCQGVEPSDLIEDSSPRHYKQAIKSYYHALTILKDMGDQSGQAVTLHNIGLVYNNLGKYERALDHYQQSLAISLDIGDPAGQGRTLVNIGFVYKNQGNTAQAIDLLKQAIEVKESIQGDLKIEELKTSFAAEQINVYEKLIRLLFEEDRFEEAFYYVERSRARAFLDQIANGRLNIRRGADSKLLQQEEILKAQIAALRIQLAQLLKQERSVQNQTIAPRTALIKLRTALIKLRNHSSNELDTEAIASVQKQLSDCEKDYTKVLTLLKLQSSEVASLVSTDVLTLEEIQGLLDPCTTLVEYFVCEEVALVFIITRNSFQTIDLNSSPFSRLTPEWVTQEKLTKTIEAFRRFATLKNPHPQNLQQLHKWLIAPVKSYLTTSKLAIVAHGVLHYLPFAALTDGKRYLSDEYSIVTLPSASVLRFLSEKRKPSTGTLLALGNPTPAEPLPALHYAEQEAKTIAQLYGTQALVGAAATKTAVFSQSGSAEILHIAAHGKYNRHNPLFSTLYLAPDDQHDGRLEVHDIYSLDLTAATNLVVLSACQTQLGELSKGDEVVGLNRAFLYAGTPSVMATLWSVDDKVTGLLMERFYTHLRSGMTKAHALRQAQMDVRAEYPHPYYWAAFVLTGDGAEMTNDFQIV
jgi:CHAT domain-containing protein